MKVAKESGMGQNWGQWRGNRTNSPNSSPQVGLEIVAVAAGSLGEELELAPGDRLVAVNEEPLTDLIALQAATAEPTFTLRVRKGNGEEWELEVEHDPEEGLGLTFAGAVSEVRRCANHCLFCFVDRMPPGCRASLYLKDDDYRLSFLQGNFITLTNLWPADWERIIRLHLSPLYVSIHTTNPELRARILGTARARGIMQDLARLREAGIEVHGQLVLCPGLNDGLELARTLADLGRFWPSLRSVAVVPVGLTGWYRGRRLEGNPGPPLRRYTPAEARTLLEEVARWQGYFRRELGTRLVYAADEFYLLAGESFPPAEAYEDFPQLANGVGLCRRFLEELQAEWPRLVEGLAERERLRDVTVRDGPGEKRDAPRPKSAPLRVGFLTGLAAAPVLLEVTRRVNALTPALLHVDVCPVPNHFFGPQVTVTGLLTGQDVRAALAGAEKRTKAGATPKTQEQEGQEEILFLPDICLRSGEETFLDGETVQTVAAVARAGGRRLQVIPTGAAGLVTALLEVCPNLPGRTT